MKDQYLTIIVLLLSIFVLGSCSFFNPDEPRAVLEGTIALDRTLSPEASPYLLKGEVIVKGRLNIEAGTVIMGEKASSGTLVIHPEGQIFAHGTKDSAIVFTSDQAPEQRAPGDWGGIIVVGQAEKNTTDGPSYCKGTSVSYDAGFDDNHSSGEIIYSRIEYAGQGSFENREAISALTLCGVGKGTRIHHIQVHQSKGDGFRFVGGKAKAKYLVCTACGQSSFSWTEGWTGKGQFWLSQQWGDSGTNGITGENVKEGSDDNSTPISDPDIFNITLIGNPQGFEESIGVRVRRSTKGWINNSIIVGFRNGGVLVEDTETCNILDNDTFRFNFVVFSENEPTIGDRADECDEVLRIFQGAHIEFDPDEHPLVRPFDINNSDFCLTEEHGLPLGNTPTDEEGFFDTSATYLGAFSAPFCDDWTVGWTTKDRS